MTIDFIALPGFSTALGEGPIWHPEEHVLYFVDILGAKVFRYDPESEESTCSELPAQVGCVIPCAGHGVIAAAQDGFYWVDGISGNSALLMSIKLDEQLRLNDGKCSPAGSIWVGELNQQFAALTARLLSTRLDGELRTVISPVSLSNGLVWSLDQSEFYYIDTPTNRIARYQYDKVQDNVVGAPEHFEFAENQGYPDGMCIDADGLLWIAHFAGGCISRWNPANGEMIERIELPVENVTSLCFGGVGYKDLYVTTAYDGLNEEQRAQQPLAGALFRATTSYNGIAPDLFTR